MPQFSLCIATYNFVALGKRKPLFDLFFTAEVFDGGNEHGLMENSNELANIEIE
jgi:hypothetical protein